MTSKHRRRKSIFLVVLLLASTVSTSAPTAALPQSQGLETPEVLERPQVFETLESFDAPDALDTSNALDVPGEFDAPDIDVSALARRFSLSATTTLTVDADGSGDYRTIQSAVDNASAGDTIRIEPGTYSESVRVSKPLDIRAPSGATLDGSSLGSSTDAIRLYNDANVEISGLTISGYDAAIYASHVDRNFSIADTTMRDNRRGLYVDDTHSTWEIHGSVIENNVYAAVQTSSSSLGDATDNYWGRSDGPQAGQCQGNVDCGYFRSSPDDSVTVPADRTGTYVVANDGTEPYATIQDAIRAAPSRATVEVRPGTYRNSVRLSKPLSLAAPDGATLNGSESSNSEGIRLYNDANVTVSGFTIEKWNHGIEADHVDSEFSIENVVLRRNNDGLYANDNSESWAIRGSEIYDNSYSGVQGYSHTMGDATDNYWGQSDGPKAGQCQGDVDCGYFRNSPDDSVSVPVDRTGTYVVANDGTEPYATIQDAIRAAPSRATVEVRPGTYRNSVRLSKPLSLVAPSGATLNGSESSSSEGLRLYNDANVTVSGFTIEEWNHGIEADHVDSEFSVENVVLRRNNDGLYANDNAESWAIRDSEIYNNSYSGVQGYSHTMGNATANYWGQSDGPKAGQCQGDVDCGYFLSSPDGSVSVPADRTGTYTVAADGTEPYATIQDAIRAAPSRATVEVRSGTYRESVRLEKPLSLVAPSGATLNGSESSNSDGIRLYNNANVTVSGFTIEEWNHGIDANHVDSEFAVESVVLRRNNDGLYVDDSHDPWSIRASEIYNNSYTGVHAHSSTLGDATDNYWGRSDGPRAGQCRDNVDCGYFRPAPDDSVTVPEDRTGTYVVANDGTEPYATIQDAIEAAPSGETIDVRSGTYRNTVRLDKPLSLVASSGATLNGSDSGGDGIRLYNNANVTVSGFTIEEWNHGIDANHVDSEFAVENVVLRRNNDGLYVDDSHDPWSIRASEIYNNSHTGVRGHSSTLGDATANYWGQSDGPKAGQCRDDVDCGYFLSSPDGSVSVPEDRTRTYVVANDGTEPYATIQDAIEAAPTGESIEVRPGTYRNTVRLDKPLSLVAPSGATLNGSDSGGDGIRLYNNANVTVSGFTIEEWNHGIDANHVDREFAVENVVLRRNNDGLYVDDNHDPWSIHGSEIYNNSHTGVRGHSSTLGDATDNYWGRSDGPKAGQCRDDVDCGYFRDSPDDSVSVPPNRTGTYVVANDGTEPYATIQDAIEAAPTRATVEVRPGTYRNTVRLDKPLSLAAPDGATLNGSNSGGDGIRLYNNANVTVSGFTIEEWNHGIDANHVDREFSVENVVLRRNNDGLYADDIHDPWEIHASEIYNNSHTGVRGHSSQVGDATDNYWGRSDGPRAGQCRDDVDCGYFRHSPDDSVSVPSNRTGTYVVGNDGTEPYATIQDAIEAAPTRATVEVRPGTYTRSVRLDKPLSLVAPDGATLNGSKSSGHGIRLYNDANVTVSGFTIEEWNHGIDANHVDREFVVENVVLRRNNDGLYTDDNHDPWGIHGSEIYNNSHSGVRGHSSRVGNASGNYWGQSDGPTRAQCRGDVDCGYFLSSPDGSVDIPLVRPRVLVVADDGSAPYATIQDAVQAAESGETVEVRPGVYRERVRIRQDINLTAPRGAVLNGSTLGSSADGISLSNAGGASISGFVVREFDAGIRANGVDRSVSIGNSHLVNNSYGLRVRYANAPWEIHDSLVANNSATGVYAYHSDNGDATRNYWGQLGGPLDGQCDPEIDCSNPLSQPPEVRGDRISYTSPSELEFNIGMREPVANRSLRFQSAGVTMTDAEIETVGWNFGDGTTATGRKAAHTYDSPGVYTVSHSAVTEDGRAYSVTQQIRVGEEPDEFGVVSVTPHLSGNPREDVVVIEGLPLDLTYRAAVSQPSNTEEVQFQLGNATYTDSDGSDGYTFPMNESAIDGDATLTATAVHTNGSTASKAIRVGYVSTPEWFQSMSVAVKRPTRGELVLESSNPVNVSNRIPAEFPFKDEVEMPGTGENQSTSGAVTVTVKVDLMTTETEVSVGGEAGYSLEVVEVGGSATGTAFLDLEEGDLRKGQLELVATGSAEYPPPPTGVPSPPVGPVPPGVVSLYPMFNAELKVVTTFDEKDTAGSGDDVAFEFEDGEVAPTLGAKQELGKKWNEFALVLGLEEEIATTAPLPELRPIEGTVAGQLYARAQAYMFTKEAYYPSGADDRFTYDFSLLEDGTTESTTSGVGATETPWRVRDASGDRPPKPEYETREGTRQTAGTRTGFADASFETDGAMPTKVVDTGVVTDNTVADESPAVTRTGDGHTVVWSQQSGGKSALNGRDVQVARMDGNDITTLSPITDDEMGDFDPAVAGSDANGSLAAFTTFNRTFEDATAPSDAYPHGEIRVATADDSGWNAPEFLTDDDDFDFGPEVAQRGDEWVVAWTQDADGNLSTWRDQSVQYVRYNRTAGIAGPVQSVETARAPDVAATDDGFRVGYLAMGDGSSDGTLTVETVRAESGLPKQSERTIPVGELGDLDVSTNNVGFIDTAANDSLTVANETDVREIPLKKNVSTPQTVELTERNGDLLVNFRAYPATSDVAAAFYKPRIDGQWLPARKYADGSTRNLTFWQGSAASTTEGFVSVFAGQDLTSDQQADVYAFKHQFRPDLTVNASVDAENVGVGDEVTVEYELRNAGDAAADASALTVQSGASTLETVGIGSLSVGETVTGTATVTVDETGLLSVTADADGELAEFDEANNDARALRLRPDLNVTAVTATRDNDTVTVSATVTNPSDVRAGNVEYRLGNGPTLQRYGTIPVLEPDSTRRVNVSVPAGDIDPSYTTRFEVDPNGTAAERNASNNERSRYLFQPDLGIGDGQVGYYERDGTVRASVLVSNAGLADVDASIEVRDAESGNLLGSRNVTAEGSDSVASATFTEATVDLPGVSAGDSVEVLVTAPSETALGDNVIVDEVELDTTLVPPTGDIRVSQSAIDVDESVRLDATNLSDPDGETVRTQWNVSDSAFAADSESLNWTGRSPGEHRVRLVVVDADGMSTVVTETVLVRPPRPEVVLGAEAPRDVNGDGRFRDVDGDGEVGSEDARTFFESYRNESVRANEFAFDFNEDDGDIDVLDVQALHAQAENETQ